MNMKEIKQEPVTVLPELPVLDRLLELGAMKPAVLVSPKGTPFMVMPKTCEVVDVSKYEPPQFIKQDVMLQDVESFTAYVNAFKLHNTLIFANIQGNACRFVAAIDYHEPGPDGRPGRVTHRAAMGTEFTPEWADLMDFDGFEFDQVTFAEFLEQRVKLFVEPIGANLLELVQNLHGASNVRFSSAMRLQSGAHRFHFDGEVELRGQAGGGDIELPKELRLGIAPFVGLTMYSVQVRLKYRIKEHKLVIWYEVVDKQHIVRDAIMELVCLVKDKTGLTPMIGQIH